MLEGREGGRRVRVGWVMLVGVRSWVIHSRIQGLITLFLSGLLFCRVGSRGGEGLGGWCCFCGRVGVV